jgi:RNA polymerase sigma-70 factor (ECF subfamily)
MNEHGGRTDQLLSLAGRGDCSALGRLLERHRSRLRQAVAVRFDRRLVARFDPSDIVQEALADAGRRLPEFLRDRPVGFFPWLRRLAVERLIEWRRAHLRSNKRSVAREVGNGFSIAGPLVDRLVGSWTSASELAAREETRTRIRDVVASLPFRDREILDLRYNEGLPFAEIAVRLGVRLGAVKMRHLRAVERVHAMIDASRSGSDMR